MAHVQGSPHSTGQQGSQSTGNRKGEEKVGKVREAKVERWYFGWYRGGHVVSAVCVF